MQPQINSQSTPQTGWAGSIKPLLLLLSIPLLNLVYPLLNNAGRPVRELGTAVDDAIPFLSAFAVPYLLWYLFVFALLVLLCFKDRTTYYGTLVAFQIGLIASYITFFFFQSTVARPELTSQDWTTSLVRFVYWSDQPYNCFPSIHVLTTYLIMRAVLSSSIRNVALRAGTAVMSILIILSTLFIKQHVIVDAAGGILLGEAAFLAGGALVKALNNKEGGFSIWHRKRYSSLTMKKKS